MVVLFYTVPINMEFANMELLYVYILWRYRSYLQTEQQTVESWWILFYSSVKKNETDNQQGPTL